MVTHERSSPPEPLSPRSPAPAPNVVRAKGVADQCRSAEATRNVFGLGLAAIIRGMICLGAVAGPMAIALATRVWTRRQTVNHLL